MKKIKITDWKNREKEIEKFAKSLYEASPMLDEKDVPLCWHEASEEWYVRDYWRNAAKGAITYARNWYAGIDLSLPKKERGKHD